MKLVTRRDVSNNNKKDSRPNAPPPQNDVAQLTDTVTAQVCYYHQTFDEKACLCSEPCSYFKPIGQRELANIASCPFKLLYVADKHNKCKYLIDTGSAVSVLPKSCANRTSDAVCLPLVAVVILLLTPTVIVDASSTLVLNEITRGHS